MFNGAIKLAAQECEGLERRVRWLQEALASRARASRRATRVGVAPTKRNEP